MSYNLTTVKNKINWRQYKQYCLNTIDKLNNSFFKNNTQFENFNNSFHRTTNRILNSKFNWKDKAKMMYIYEQRFKRKINRSLNYNNINYNLHFIWSRFSS